MIFYFNMALTVVCLVYYAVKTARGGMFLSPHMIVWGIPLILVLYPALQTQSSYLSDTGYNLIITCGLLGTLCACLAMEIPSYVKQESNQGAPSKIDLPDWLVGGGALVYAAYLASTVVLLVIRYGGVVNALIIGRVQDYLAGGILVGQTYQLLFLVPEILFYVYIGRLLDKRQYLRAACAACVLSVFFVFTSNTRLPMIMPFMALSIVMISWLKRELMPYAMPVILTAGIISVFAFSVVGNSIRGGHIDEMNLQFTSFQETISNQKSTDLGYYDWMYDLYASINEGRVDHDYGMAWVYYAPISFFPRFLWPAKPLTSTSNRLTEAVYDITIGEGQPITTFTIYGEGFWQAHYFGAFLAGYLFLYLHCLLIRLMLRFKYTEYWIALIFLQMVTYFRAELPMVPIMLDSLIIAIFYCLRVRSAPEAESQFDPNLITSKAN